MASSKIIIYQVFTRLYGNKNTTRKEDGTLAENGCGKLNDFTPTALKKIRTMGVSHIWYTGVIRHATQTDYSAYGIPRQHPAVVKGKAGSPYAITDYYDIDPVTGRSSKWIGYIRNTIAQVACNFTTNRMLTDYLNQYYDPQAARTAELCADDFAQARKIAAWKKHMRAEWWNVQVVSYTQPDASYSLSPTNSLESEVVLRIGDLDPNEIGVEILFTTTGKDGRQHIRDVAEYEVVECNAGVARYRASILPERTGMYQVATRMYAKNPLLPHRQDFELVRWL